MAGGGGGGGGQQQSSEYAPIWITVAACVTLIILWYFGHAYISAIIYKIRLAEIKLLSFFTNSAYGLRAQILATPASTAKFNFIADISTAVGQKFIYPLCGLSLIFVFLLYRLSNANRYSKIYSMKALVDQEVKNWPQISPVSQLNLVAEHIHEGAWAMSMTPMQFAKKYKLLEITKVPDETGLAHRYKFQVKVIESRATRVFTQQLGRPWRGADKLPIHSRALFAIFAAKANADRTGATKLLRQIASSGNNLKKLDFTGTDELLKKHLDSKIIRKAMQAHAYELTLMASLLEIARLDGILATAEFLWLKPIDRTLWFMLNNVGRRTAFTETAGPYAHWLAERLIGRKLVVPMVHQATIALTAAMEEIVYNPEQDF